MTTPANTVRLMDSPLASLGFFSAVPVNVFGYTFPTASALTYASFNSCPRPQERTDLERGFVLNQIRDSKDYGEVAKIARCNEELVRDDWPKVRAGVAYLILTRRLQQNPSLLATLINTGDAMIEDDSWRHPYWGVPGANTAGVTHVRIRHDYLLARGEWSKDEDVKSPGAAEDDLTAAAYAAVLATRAKDFIEFVEKRRKVSSRSDGGDVMDLRVWDRQYAIYSGTGEYEII